MRVQLGVALALAVVTAAGGQIETPPRAIVLFDGDDTSAFVMRKGGADVTWPVIDGDLVVDQGAGDIVTRRAFGDCLVHMEWFSPPGGDFSLQRNGNSGVKLQNRYEIQIMNTPGAPRPAAHNEAGAIYRFKAADHNASTGPGTWQTYDIWFTAARWHGEEKISPARMTVCWNGILIHDDVPVTRKTGLSTDEAPGDGPLLLQAHQSGAEGDVRFRNVWILPDPVSAGVPPPTTHIRKTAPGRVLVFSRTAGYRHVSIEPGTEMIRILGRKHGFMVDATEDSSVFEEGRLGHYQVIVFLSTTGDVLDKAQQEGLQAWVRTGGGFVGIHAASNTEQDWPWFMGLVGASFKKHPRNQEALVRVPLTGHPSTSHLSGDWTRFDEWYDFLAPPPEDVTVLASIDQTTYRGSTMKGDNHPIAWCRPYDGGRSWYTAMGHTVESYVEPAFRLHILGGIAWAAGMDDLPKEHDESELLPSGMSRPVGE